MTPFELDELRKIADPATPRPWIAVPNPMRSDGMFVSRLIPDDQRERYKANYLDRAMRGEPPPYVPLPAILDAQVPPNDAVFIVAAANYFLPLLDEIARLQKPPDDAEISELIQKMLHPALITDRRGVTVDYEQIRLDAEALKSAFARLQKTVDVAHVLLRNIQRNGYGPSQEAAVWALFPSQQEKP